MLRPSYGSRPYQPAARDRLLLGRSDGLLFLGDWVNAREPRGICRRPTRGRYQRGLSEALSKCFKMRLNVSPTPASYKAPWSWCERNSQKKWWKVEPGPLRRGPRFGIQLNSHSIYLRRPGLDRRQQRLVGQVARRSCLIQVNVGIGRLGPVLSQDLFNQRNILRVCGRRMARVAIACGASL